MTGLTAVVLAATAFVGTHLLLSHPLRRPLVAAIGASAFLGLYSVIAVVTLGLLALAYRAAPPSLPLWPVGDGVWAAASLVMLLAAVLLIGSLVGNPAFPAPAGAAHAPAAPRGVYAITRHPMMWAFALWGLCHITVYPLAANIVLATAIIVLALVGAALQDGKKAQLQPQIWPAWQAQTSYWPFQALAAGRAKPSGPGLQALAGGLVVWLAATWAHIPLAGWAAGIWRWV